jgi:hypothetical protein
MGIRETLNQRPRLAAGLAAGLCAIAVPLMIWANSSAVGRVANAYYSDDGGKTFFADDVDKIYPFDRNGKPAYRAYVYKCGGKEFVSYLARYPDSTKAKLAELEKKSGDPEAAGQIAQMRSTSIEVRKPGDEKWVALFSNAGQQIASHPPCPEGGTAMMASP